MKTFVLQYIYIGRPMERGNSAETNPHTATVAAITEADSGERTENDRRIVVVGRTGAGKSATGNTILQMRAFQSKASGSSVTKICERQIKQILGKRIILIDTPGLLDTNLAQGELTREIIRCFTMSAPGPHVFLLVLRLDRFTKEDIDTFGLLSDIFGERMSEFSVIAFTHLDDLEHDDSSIEQFISSSDDALKNLLRKVNNRYIGFNNRAPNDEKHRQSEAVLSYVEEIVEKNGGNWYTTEYYKEAEEILRRKIQEVERIKAEEKQREIEKIEKKFAGEIKAAKDFNILLSKTIEMQKVETAKIKEEQRKNQAKLERLHFHILDQNKKHQKVLSTVRDNMTQEMDSLDKKYNEVLNELELTNQLYNGMINNQPTREFKFGEEPEETETIKELQKTLKSRDEEISRLANNNFQFSHLSSQISEQQTALFLLERRCKNAEMELKMKPNCCTIM